ncbi:hypothetical protein BJX65DRAFT_309337 [Aspergillus insuetus]
MLQLPSDSSVPTPRSERTTNHVLTQHDGINDRTQDPSSITPPSPFDPFNTHHLRLLLNWTTSTSHSISRTPADGPVWQRTIPERALSCPYLLHGIFTVSALHLALSTNCQGSEKRTLIEAASHHQSAAIAMFTREDADLAALRLEGFALSALLIGAAFAFPLAVAAPSRPPPPPGTGAAAAAAAGTAAPSAVDELVEVFLLSRKMITYLGPAMHGLQRSELSAFFLLDDVDGVSNLSRSSRGSIDALWGLIEETYPATADRAGANHHHNNHRAIYTETITHLATLLGKLDGGGEMVSNSFNWINEVPDGYIELLRVHEPLALVILAHFCVVLYWLRERWWVARWGERVLQEIVGVLGPRWKGRVSWVIGVFENRK